MFTYGSDLAPTTNYKATRWCVNKLASVDWSNEELFTVAEIDCTIDVGVNIGFLIPVVVTKPPVVNVKSDVPSLGTICVLQFIVAVLIFENVVDGATVVVFEVVYDDVVAVVIIGVLDNDSIINDEWNIRNILHMKLLFTFVSFL